MAVTLLAVIYNAVLAAANARGFPVGYAVVAATEAMILCAAALLLIGHRIVNEDIPVLAFGFFFAILGIAVSLLNDRIFLDAIRSVAIICVFTMLGLRADRRTVQRIFLAITALVLPFLLLEILATSTYVSIFQPALYFEQSRGIEQFDLDESGLFRNALGFDGRMKLSTLTQHRTASIFVEQVSLANYAGILTIFLLAMWRSLGWPSRVLHVVTIILILLSNSTRTTTTLAGIAVLGYFVYPRLPRYLIAAVAPVLLGAAVLVTRISPESHGDDLAGRLGLTVRALGKMDIQALTGLRIEDAPRYLDSGYPWVIVTSTVFGLLAFWAFVSFFPAQRTQDERRAAWALTFFIFTNMLIAGTAIFSAKVAPPLWLMIGLLRRSRAEEDEPAGAGAAEPVRTQRGAVASRHERPLRRPC